MSKQSHVIETAQKSLIRTQAELSELYLAEKSMLTELAELQAGMVDLQDRLSGIKEFLRGAIAERGSEE